MPNQNLVQDILTELGINELPPDRQEEVLTAMTGLFLKRLTVRLLESLNEEQRKEFDAVSSSGETEKVVEFFSKNVPGYEQIAQDEIAKFKTEMRETVDGLLA